jgi:hypothetical protein
MPRLNRASLFLAAFALSLGAALPLAYAQTASVVSSCGSSSFTAGDKHPLQMTAGGVLCTSTSGGGGGSVTQGTSPWVVGIAQTTDITTNGVEIAPTAGSAAGITPVVSSAAESNHVLKGSAGNLYSLYVTTGATAGYLMTFNATSAPADGAVTPIDCVQAPANQTTGLTFGSGPPDVYSTGITAVFSSTGCFTKTASATAFFKGRAK